MVNFLVHSFINCYYLSNFYLYLITIILIIAIITIVTIIINLIFTI